MPHGKGSLPELYLRDLNARRIISRLKWFISTCLVGAAGLCIIGIAMYASTDMEDGSGIIQSIRSAGRAAMTPKITNVIEDKITRHGFKTNKIETSDKGLTTKYIIQDSIVERRNAQEFVKVKPYVRISARLSTVKPANSDQIPAFNPFDLYAAETNSSDGKETQTVQLGKAPDNDYVTTRLVELAGGFLPVEDGQVLNDDEIERYVAEADIVYAESAAQLRPDGLPDAEGDAEDSVLDPGGLVSVSYQPEENLAHTTILEKIPEDDDNNNDEQELQSIIVSKGDTLIGILKGAGAEAWQAQSIAETMQGDKKQAINLRAGQEVRLKLAPAATDPTVKEPVKLSIFNGVNAEVTVERTDSGSYVLTDDPVPVIQASRENEDDIERATIYSSIYSAALAQNLDPEIVKKLMRTLVYDVDYKQRVRPGDSFELFFDVKETEDGEETPGELLYVAMTVGNDSMNYYRFRTPDGEVDFYNGSGSNARKFLMRSPIKSGRFTSGFGYRRHPLLGIKKMHTGVDWAAPTGTPIVAAGNGVIEVAGRQGGNGNYIRIRHGNGYKTAYSHMSRFADGIKKGHKVRQGQLIGYVGSTGLSTGPHLHYEVLINSRFTNPLKVHVPRSRQLHGRMLSEFKKEQRRIEELMHRAPVKTQIAAAE